MKIHEGFAEIADRFDVLLVDAYGVFWDGGRFFPGSLEVMEEAVKKGRQVCILSNTTSLSADSVRSYEKKRNVCRSSLYRFCHFRRRFQGSCAGGKTGHPRQKHIYLGYAAGCFVCGQRLSRCA